MEITEKLYVTNREDWRAWLEKNYKTKKEIWLLFYKKHTKKKTIPYDDAVEEALCFGWIDSTVKRIDHEKHVQRFTPRNLNSVWSKYNVDRVKRMIKEGKMTKIGLDKYEYGIKKKLQAHLINEAPSVPKDLHELLKKDKQALDNFNNLGKSYRAMYIYWINSAKKQETRERRIKKVVQNSKKNIKPWEKYQG